MVENSTEYPESGQVVMGKVDCDKEGTWWKIQQSF